MKTEFVPDLISKLGMTEREAKLYVAMLEKPEWKSGELHKLTGVPRVPTHQTLELMVSKHYCSKRSEGRFNFYRATPPDVLQEILEDRWQGETSEKIKHSHDILGPLIQVYQEATKNDRSMDFIEIVQTPHRIHQRFRELVMAAEEEICAFNKSPYSFMESKTPKKDLDEQTEVQKKSNMSRTTNRVIVMYEKEYWDMMSPEYSKSEVTDIRVIDYLPIKLIVIDSKIVMMGISSIMSLYKSGMSQIIIHDRDFATLCRDVVFETYWKKATPFKDWDPKR